MILTLCRREFGVNSQPALSPGMSTKFKRDLISLLLPYLDLSHPKFGSIDPHSRDSNAAGGLATLCDLLSHAVSLSAGVMIPIAGGLVTRDLLSFSVSLRAGVTSLFLELVSVPLKRE